MGMKVFIASGVSILIAEFKLDRGFARFALLATAPFLVCVSLVSSLDRVYQGSSPHSDGVTQFFALQIVGNICML